jgi:hypothetical protein
VMENKQLAKKIELINEELNEIKSASEIEA